MIHIEFDQLVDRFLTSEKVQNLTQVHQKMSEPNFIWWGEGTGDHSFNSFSFLDNDFDSLKLSHPKPISKEKKRAKTKSVAKKTLYRSSFTLLDLPSEIFLHIVDFIIPFFSIMTEKNSIEGVGIPNAGSLMIDIVVTYFKNLGFETSGRYAYLNVNKTKFKIHIMEYAWQNFLNLLLVNKECFHDAFITDTNDVVQLWWEFLAILVSSSESIVDTVMNNTSFHSNVPLDIKFNTNKLIGFVLGITNSPNYFCERFLMGNKFRLLGESKLYDNLGCVPDAIFQKSLAIVRQHLKKYKTLVTNEKYIKNINEEMVRTTLSIEEHFDSLKKQATKSVDMIPTRIVLHILKLMQLVYIECKIPLLCETSFQASNIYATMVVVDRLANSNLFSTIFNSNILENTSKTVSQQEFEMIEVLFAQPSLLTSLVLSQRYEEVLSWVNIATIAMSKSRGNFETIGYLVEHVIVYSDVLYHQHDVTNLMNVISKVWTFCAKNNDSDLYCYYMVTLINKTCIRLTKMDDRGEGDLKSFTFNLFCKIFRFLMRVGPTPIEKVKLSRQRKMPNILHHALQHLDVFNYIVKLLRKNNPSSLQQMLYPEGFPEKIDCYTLFDRCFYYTFSYKQGYSYRQRTKFVIMKGDSDKTLLVERMVERMETVFALYGMEDSVKMLELSPIKLLEKYSQKPDISSKARRSIDQLISLIETWGYKKKPEIIK